MGLFENQEGLLAFADYYRTFAGWFTGDFRTEQRFITLYLYDILEKVEFGEMEFETNTKIKKLGEKIGFVFAFLIFCSMLYLILTLTHKI